MHRYLRIVASFHRVAHLAKKNCVNATIFRTICGEAKKTRKKVLGISEAELLRFDCVSRFYLQDQCSA